MALMNCPECGKEISDQVNNCPHCGFPVNNKKDEGSNKKKKVIPVVIAAIVLLLILAAFFIYKFVYKGSFQISQGKDTIELGTDVDLIKYLEYSPEDIIDVTIVDDGGFDCNAAGDYQVLFNVKNKRGNIKQVQYDFHVTDTVPPELTVLKDTVYVAKGSSYQPESNAEAADADSCTVEVSGDYDLNAEGTYEIVFTAKDGSGNQSEKKSMTLIVENRDDCLFRNAKLGDSAEVIQRYETGELFTKQDEDNGESLIIYEDTVEGEDAYIYYQMNDKDQLCCITVIFMQPHTDYDIYINKFDSITEKLTLDYGEPKKEKGKGRLYGYCSSEGEALSIGEGKFRNLWSSDDVDIVLYLGSDNYEISFAMIYDSNTLDHPEGTGLN